MENRAQLRHFQFLVVGPGGRSPYPQSASNERDASPQPASSMQVKWKTLWEETQNRLDKIVK